MLVGSSWSLVSDVLTDILIERTKTGQSDSPHDSAHTRTVYERLAIGSSNPLLSTKIRSLQDTQTQATNGHELILRLHVQLPYDEAGDDSQRKVHDDRVRRRHEANLGEVEPANTFHSDIPGFLNGDALDEDGDGAPRREETCGDETEPHEGLVPLSGNDA